MSNNFCTTIVWLTIVFSFVITPYASAIISHGAKIIEVNPEWVVTKGAITGYEITSFFNNSNLVKMAKYYLSDDFITGCDFYLLQKCDKNGNTGEIDEHNEMRYFRVIDSGFTYNLLQLCAPNAVWYFQSDSIYTHIITVIADTVAYKDTLISFRNKDTSLNLTTPYFQRSAEFFLQDSLLVTRILDKDILVGYLLQKIGADNSFQFIRKVKSFRDLSFCNDFSQVYFEERKGAINGPGEYNKIVIYDLPTGYIQDIGSNDLENDYTKPRRCNRSNDIYFIKRNHDKLNEIWRMNKNGDQEFIYAPEDENTAIKQYQILDGWIQLWLNIKTDEGYKDTSKQIKIQ